LNGGKCLQTVNGVSACDTNAACCSACICKKLGSAGSQYCWCK
jgi:hypothetical protein